MWNTQFIIISGFHTKAKAHILPWILTIHQGTDPSNDISLNVELGNDDALADLPAKLTDVIFKANRIYWHRLLQINYTTYNLRCESDAVNLHTNHCDIMLLSCADIDIDGSSQHPFCYTRVLGIFHANVIYTGPGSRDYQSRHIEFLWVWWFELLKDRPLGWQHSAFDTTRFVLMAEEDTFGFMGPGDVLRACHLIPSFADSLLHSDGIAVSSCTCDSGNWKHYYINRCGLYLAGSTCD